MAFDPSKAGAAVNENMASSMQGFAAASKAMQAVTNEMVGMSMASMQKTSEAFQQMQGARSFADVLRIQQEFFRTSFEEFASRSRKIAELATAAPVELAKRATDTAVKAGEQTKAAATAIGHQAGVVTAKAADDVKAATVGLG